MKPQKKRPLGKAPKLQEPESVEAATPATQDIERADELAQTDEVLSALWNAQPKKEGE